MGAGPAVPMNPPKYRPKVVSALIETFGFSPALATSVTLFLILIGVAVVIWVVQSAPPRRLVLTSGPEGSSFERWALAYQKELSTHGVTLEIRPSTGSLDNLKRLQAPGSPVDIGFVSGGPGDGVTYTGLVSLGSISYQPLWVFYRAASPIAHLSDLAGKKIALGAAGSSTRSLALVLLADNGVSGPATTFIEQDSAAAAKSLLDGEIDAVFMMGDSASIQTLRSLVHAQEIYLYNFSQADAYVRRYPYLNKMSLPEGSLDLGKDLPATNTALVGPTVELVAKSSLNSALSDLLLEVAQDVHGKSGLLQKQGDFPAAIEHDIPLSSDAVRYYKSGKGFLYNRISSFWVANLLNRLLVAVVPLIIVLIPTVRLLPVAYRWTIRLRLYRCYRTLLHLEKDAEKSPSAAQVALLLKRLDEIDETVFHLKVPMSFADQYYALRGHIAFVRQRLTATPPA